jgi:hypothetical protein
MFIWWYNFYLFKINLCFATQTNDSHTATNICFQIRHFPGYMNSQMKKPAHSPKLRYASTSLKGFISEERVTLLQEMPDLGVLGADSKLRGN